MLLVVIIAAVIFGYALVSRSLEDSAISAPMIFTGAGVLVGPLALGWVDFPSLGTGAVGVLAEATLILVLFTDAIRIDVRELRRDARLPTRLLTIGMPLTLLGGTAVAYWFFGAEFGWSGALVLAAILTPTDAALGKPVVIDLEIPVRIRQTINVESGLNDGIMLPVVTVAVILLQGEAGETEVGLGALMAREIGFGLLFGALIGGIGGVLLDRFASRGRVEPIMRQLGTLAIGVGAFAVADLMGGNGFVAAFTAGAVFGYVAREHCEGANNFATDEGELLTLITFFLFGSIVIPSVVDDLSMLTLAYAALSLTVIRMVPVVVSLLGSGLQPVTSLFVGWFGPRGLASILFGVFLLEETGLEVSDSIFAVVVWTVILSIVAHGASAASLSRRYSSWYRNTSKEGMAEAEEMFQYPIR